MAERDERETAYFALLRAREELELLHRYQDHLGDELRRLRRSVSEDEALRAAVPDRMRRVLRSSDTELAEVLARRTALIEDELGRLPSRIAAAEDFVIECERHHDVLGGR